MMQYGGIRRSTGGRPCFLDSVLMAIFSLAGLIAAAIRDHDNAWRVGVTVTDTARQDKMNQYPPISANFLSSKMTKSSSFDSFTSSSTNDCEKSSMISQCVWCERRTVGLIDGHDLDNRSPVGASMSDVDVAHHQVESTPRRPPTYVSATSTARYLPHAPRPA